MNFVLDRVILETSDENLFFIDWGKGSKTLDYSTARYRIDEVANVLTNFIKFLQQSANLNPSNTTLIGFSLGAHICGLVGKQFTDKMLKKIIGIDPAGPLFDVNQSDNRLSPESATYTECIHTGYAFGIREPICHADFYFNGGANQPGCAVALIFDSVLCSHSRAVEIFIESLMSPDSFYGNRCESLTSALNKNCNEQPGAYLNNPSNEAEKLSGIFHVRTNAASPYGQGRDN